jgi:phosphoribosylformylglycinamidine synthase
MVRFRVFLSGMASPLVDVREMFKSYWTVTGQTITVASSGDRLGYRRLMEEPLHRALGLTDAEADAIEVLLGRQPNHLELAMYAVMWSEHCSYKSSRIHLRRLPTSAPWVLVGPGENAGVVDVGDGIAAAIRIESHNHPSAIEPFQGAATGVGGILRDIFTMGARPIALMDPLRFGPLDDARSRWIAEGVVSGISHYGNAVGVPTVGGEVVFDATFQGNPLVNVLCLGVLPADRLVLGQAHGEGNLAVLLGSTTGRDGIGGVSVLASAGFSEGDEAKRPSVQVGDPYEEKRLIETCLALLDAGLVVGIQDLGGAGLCCATSETASRAGMGMDVEVSAVPQREPGMQPFEIMTSESQERMLAIVAPASLDEVLAVAARWDVRATVVGRVTSGGRLRIFDRDGSVLADVPAASLHDAAPSYDRPRQRPDRSSEVEPSALAPGDLAADVLGALADTTWVSRQYDHQLFLNTVAGPGGDATVLRLKHPRTGEGTGRALALTTDGNHRWCAVDPRAGTARVVAEAVLNLACVGARPVAVVNCLNFGNPEHPEVMWQLSEAIDGMAAACRAFGVPVVGGNVSLYNESAGRDIDPTPIVGVLGVVDRLERRPPGPAMVEGASLLLLGPPGDPGAGLVGSRWAWERGARGGSLEPLDHAAHHAVTELVRDLVNGGLLAGAHDIADGGLAVTLLEMAVASATGLVVDGLSDGPDGWRALVAESPSRVVVAAVGDRAAAVARQAETRGVACRRLGQAGGDRVRIGAWIDVGLDDAIATWRDRLPRALGVAAEH